jgi:hypothetical protein
MNITTTKLRQLCLQDLAKSKLNKKDATLLHLKFLNVEETNGIRHIDPTIFKFSSEPDPGKYIKAISIEFPYFSLKGEKTGFSRHKLIYLCSQEELSLWWKSQPNKKSKHPPKYLQKANTGVHAYFPPYFDWEEVAEDPSVQITITEGEKKSACACKHGIKTIGLGGVWNFGKKESQGMIDTLLKIRMV